MAIDLATSRTKASWAEHDSRRHSPRRGHAFAVSLIHLAR